LPGAYNVREDLLAKTKRLLSSPRLFFRSVNIGARQFGAFPPHPTKIKTALFGLTTGPFPGIEQQIISTIKTIRKKN
jgi:hypothetical protein